MVVWRHAPRPVRPISATSACAAKSSQQEFGCGSRSQLRTVYQRLPRSISMRLGVSALRRFLRFVPRRSTQDARLEQIVAAGVALQAALRKVSDCRRICFGDRNQAALERCRQCHEALRQTQLEYQQATERLRRRLISPAKTG